MQKSDDSDQVGPFVARRDTERQAGTGQRGLGGHSNHPFSHLTQRDLCVSPLQDSQPDTQERVPTPAERGARAVRHRWPGTVAGARHTLLESSQPIVHAERPAGGLSKPLPQPARVAAHELERIRIGLHRGQQRIAQQCANGGLALFELAPLQRVHDRD